MWIKLIKWILKMVDITISVDNGHLRILVEFAGTVIIDRSIPSGVAEEIKWDASPKGVI